MSIQVFCGKPGAGKSLNVTDIAYHQMLKGRPVFSTYPITFNKCGLFGRNKENYTSYILEKHMISENCFPLGSLLIIDEAGGMFSSRDWKNFSTDDLILFTQHRHIGIDMLVIVQHPNRIDTVIREITEVFWWIEKIPFLPIYRLIGYYDYSEIASLTPKFKPKVRFSRFKRKVFKAYDTTYYKDKLLSRPMAEFKTWDIKEESDI